MRVQIAFAKKKNQPAALSSAAGWKFSNHTLTNDDTVVKVCVNFMAAFG